MIIIITFIVITIFVIIIIFIIIVIIDTITIIIIFITCTCYRQLWKDSANNLTSAKRRASDSNATRAEYDRSSKTHVKKEKKKLIFDRRANGLLRVNYRTGKFCLSTSFSFLSFFLANAKAGRRDAVRQLSARREQRFLIVDFSVKKRSRAKRSSFTAEERTVCLKRERKRREGTERNWM